MNGRGCSGQNEEDTNEGEDLDGEINENVESNEDEREILILKVILRMKVRM